MLFVVWHSLLSLPSYIQPNMYYFSHVAHFSHFLSLSPLIFPKLFFHEVKLNLRTRNQSSSTFSQHWEGLCKCVCWSFYYLFHFLLLCLFLKTTNVYIRKLNFFADSLLALSVSDNVLSEFSRISYIQAKSLSTDGDDGVYEGG